jgi:signal transduction histidine kinase
VRDVSKSVLRHRWTLLFLLVVILPSITLAVLMFLVFRGEQAREAYQRGERERQIARLLAVELENRLHSMSGAGTDLLLPFSLRDDQLCFPHLNLVPDREIDGAFENGDPASEPWHRARSLEVTYGDSPAAARIYSSLAEQQSPWAPSARLALLRQSLRSGNPEESAARLERIFETDLEATTASGIPIWIAAVLLIVGEDRMVEESFAEAPGPARHIEEVLRRLVEGHWELSVHRWIFFTRTLLHASAQIPTIREGLDVPAIEKTIELLEASLRLSPQLLSAGGAFRSSPAASIEAYCHAETGVVVIRLQPSEERSGLFVFERDLRQEASGILSRLTAAEDFTAALQPLDSGETEAALVPDFPFWRVLFSDRGRGGFQRLGTRLALYGGALLLLVTLAALIFTYRAISHEAHVTKLKSDFVSAVSHEFRSPLAGMEALLERLQSGRVSDPDMVERYHRTIQQELSRLGRMVNDLLEFARLEGGRKVTSFEVLDLNEVAREVIRSFSRLGQGQRLEVDAGLADSGLHMRGNRTSLSQAIHNLLDNALKYSAKNQPVHIQTEARNGQVFLSVTDQGPGIPLSEQEKVFEPFYRSGTNQDHGTKGVGLGLALVQRIMQEHDGQVRLESRPGQGSRFVLMFPSTIESYENEDERDVHPCHRG